MNRLTPIPIPLLNPNEPEALLVSVNKVAGDAVKTGEVLAVIETTKSTGEISAPTDGFLVGLRYSVGQIVQAGETLAYIGQSPADQDNHLPPWAAQDQPVEKSSSEDGIRMTQPARDLALSLGLDLTTLPKDRLITTTMIQALAETRPLDRSLPDVPDGENRIVIVGAGGHGRSLAALLGKQSIYRLVGFLDDTRQGEVSGVPVLGGLERLPELVDEGIRWAINGVGGISDLNARLKIYQTFQRVGLRCPTVIHPSAVIEESARVREGNQIFSLSYIGTDVTMGYGCIINTGAIVSHDCILSDYVNLSPGATLAGGVRLGEGVLVGMRATINLGVQIGQRARIGNGATVKEDVPEGGIVPAGTIWPARRR